MKKLETGDVIFTRNMDIIAEFMDFFQDDSCYWTHILIAKNEFVAWEASWQVRESNIEKVLNKSKDWKIIRFKALTESQRNIMKDSAPIILNQPYGFLRFFLQFLDQIFCTNWFTKHFDSKYVQVCSSFGAWLYWVACEYRFNGVPWESCDPDDIEDDQLAYSERYEIIRLKGEGV